MSIRTGDARGRVTILHANGTVHVIRRSDITSVQSPEYGFRVCCPTLFSFEHGPIETQRALYESIVDEDADVVWTQSPNLDDEGNRRPEFERWTRVPDKERLT